MTTDPLTLNAPFPWASRWNRPTDPKSLRKELALARRELADAMQGKRRAGAGVGRRAYVTSAEEARRNLLNAEENYQKSAALLRAGEDPASFNVTREQIERYNREHGAALVYQALPVRTAAPTQEELF